MIGEFHCMDDAGCVLVDLLMINCGILTSEDDDDIDADYDDYNDDG